jgi:glycine cleavage system H protein
MDVPGHLRYTEDHEWALQDGDHVRVGITEFAQGQLGDVVYVELPKPGSTVTIMTPFGVVESVKAASDLFSPLTGEVVEVNDRLADEPELVNTDPYGDGWMVVIAPTVPAELDNLMDAEAYAELIASEDAH